VTVDNVTELQQSFFPDVHVETVKCELCRASLGAHIRCPVPFIPKPNIVGQLAWAESYSHWTADDWKHVLFSDESIFQLFGLNGAECCWRRPGERLDARFRKKKVKHGGGKITVWGMITLHGLSRLVRINWNLVKELYVNILQDDFLRTLNDLKLNPRNYYFQQDNDPKHTARIVTTWFEEITLMSSCGLPTALI
jgi:hypothetical protein